MVFQRFCQTQLNAEIEEMLTGLKRRFALLGVADPEMAIVDNCCHVKNAIRRVFPDISVLLDVWHFMMRYAQFLFDAYALNAHASVLDT